MPNRQLGIKTTLPEGITLKEGDEADLRVMVKDGALVVTKVLRQSGVMDDSSDYKARLGSWNRK